MIDVMTSAISDALHIWLYVLSRMRDLGQAHHLHGGSDRYGSEPRTSNLGPYQRGDEHPGQKQLNMMLATNTTDASEHIR